MGDVEEFDPVEISRIVSVALKQNNATHMSFIDVKVLEQLHKILPKYLNTADCSYIISEIREELYDGFGISDSSSLHTAISRCVRCKADLNPDPQTPVWNVVDPDLLLVAMNPSSIGSYQNLLIQGLKDSGFKSNRCCLTYVTRCPIQKDISSSCVENCVAYLHTEIHALKPKLIITLGLDSYGATTGNYVAKSKELIGKVRWFGMYPILHQHSLGYAQRMIDNNNSFSDQFNSVFQTAYKFVYGGGNDSSS